MLLPEGHDPDSLVRVEGVDNFAQRVSSAQALSDYFFAHFTAALDLSTMEGRAKLVAQAKSHIEQLPGGVFKQMMETELKQLSQVPELVFSENPTTLQHNLIKPKSKLKKHLSPARVAIALLLQNPHLATSVMEKIPEWDELEFPGLDVLKNLLHHILNYPSLSTGALIEMYRGLALEKTIQTLASWEFLFPESGINAEFLGAIDNLIAQAKQAKITQLLEKGNHQSLSGDEQDQLKKMLANKH
jgi:DNA primase